MLLSIFLTIFITLHFASGSPSPYISNSFDLDVLKYRLSCPLEWVNYTRGDDRPSNSIPFGFQNQNINPQNGDVIARATVLGKTLVGNLKADGFATFYSSKEGKMLKEHNCEVLTNPRNCSLSWVCLPMGVSTRHASTFVKADLGVNKVGSINFVGRGRNQLHQWQGLNIPEKIFPGTAIKTSGLQLGPDYIQALQSLTPKLSYIIRNVSFSERVDTREVTFSGTDRILNKADVEVSSSVSYGISTSKGEGTDESTKITVGSGSNNVEDTTGNSSDEDDSEDMDVSRDLNVPAFTSIEACSLQSVPGLVINVLTEVTFFAEGVDANRIQEILTRENFTGPFTHSEDGASVTTMIQGDVRDVTGQLSSCFMINPVDVVEGMSCDHFSSKVDSERRGRIKSRLSAMLPAESLSQEGLVKLISDAYKTYGDLEMCTKFPG